MFVLNHVSLDAYLFLRFLRVLGAICLAGVVLLWPILLPLHATGGGESCYEDVLWHRDTRLRILFLGNKIADTTISWQSPIGCLDIRQCRQSQPAVRSRHPGMGLF